jgi:hypothetical protein
MVAYISLRLLENTEKRDLLMAGLGSLSRDRESSARAKGSSFVNLKSSLT